MEKRQLINYRQVEICRNEQIVLQKTDFELFGGEFVYLIGRVGSGKSTLLKTIYAEVPIQDGEAMVFDVNMRRIRRREIPMLRRKLGIVFQDFQLLTDRTVQKNLEFVLRATGWKDRAAIRPFVRSVWKIRLIVCHTNCREESSSVLSLHGLCSIPLKSYWQTNRPGISILKRENKSLLCYMRFVTKGLR